MEGSGFADRNTQRLTAASYAATAVVGLGKNTFRARVGGETASFSAATRRLAADSLDAVLLSSLVYHDDGAVRVALQAKDELFNSPAVWRRIKVVAAPSAELATLGAGFVHGVCDRSKQGYADVGACVVIVQLRSAWFDGAVSDEQRTVSLRYGFDGAPDETWKHLGEVVLQKRPTAVPAQNIVAYLPSRPIYPGSSFDVEIHANFNHLLETFTIDFAVGGTMKISEFILATEGGWSGTTANAGEIATLSYLRDGSALSKDSGQPAELLATMKVVVLDDAPPGVTGAVSVSWNDTSNVLDSTVIPDDTSVIVGRDGVSRSGSGQVHIEEDAPRGIFATAEQAALVNTAVLDGTTISSEIHVFEVRQSGHFEALSPLDLTCTSSDERVLAADCQRALLTPAQRVGSPGVSVTIEHVTDKLSTKVHFAVWAPALPVALNVSDLRLQAVRGWFASDDCRPMYQRSAVQASAFFSTGSPAVAEPTGLLGATFSADVTALVAGRLAVARQPGPATARIIDGPYVEGLTDGVAEVTVIGGDGQLIGAAQVVVDSTTVSVVALDAKTMKAISIEAAVATDTNLRPFAALPFNVAIDSGPLGYEGDRTEVVVDAVFADGTRMPLRPSIGLRVSSLQDASVVIEDGKYAVVPYMGSSAAGGLAKAEWAVAGTDECTGPGGPAAGVLASASVFVNVSLPKALSATITITGAPGAPKQVMFAAPGGPAARAGLRTRAGIKVELHYADRTIDATSDPRTEFRLGALAGLFQVDKATKTILAVGGAGVGTGVVAVAFQHESVAAEVNIELTAMAELIVSATPYPAFRGSELISATTLSVIGGSSPLQYEQAELHLHMRLGNGHTFELAARDVQFAAEEPAAGTTASIAGPIVTPTASGELFVEGTFSGERAQTQLAMTVSAAAVYVSRIDSAGAIQGRNWLGGRRALSGEKNAARGRMAVSVTLSNGRRLTQLFDSAGTALVPGLVDFHTDTPAAVSVDAATGLLTLRGNHWDEVSVTARATGALGRVIEQSTSFPCNLRATERGDVDLGASDGIPLKDRRVGDVFDVPLVVNTGQFYLGTFDVLVHFDPTVLSIGDPKAAVQFNPNKNQIGSGILDAVVDGGVLHFSGSIDTETLRGGSSLLVNIRLTAIGAGVSQLGGIVVLLGSTSVPADDIAVRGSDFIAGQVHQRVVGGQQRERRASSPLAGLQQHLIISARARLPHARPRRNADGCAQEYGDTNADCVFDVNDVRFVTQYLAYRGINFAGRDGPTVKGIVASSEHSRNALDADHNTEVSGKDASFLNKVNLGIFIFLKQVTATTDGCATRLSANLYTKGNGAVNVARAGVYFDVASESWLQPGLDAMQVTVGQRVTSAKGSFGMLVEAVCSDAGGTAVCTAEFSGQLAETASLGVSIAQVVAQSDGSVEAKFMAGVEKAPFQYGLPLSAQFVRFGQSVALASSGSDGYNPMTTISVGGALCMSTSTTTTTVTNPATNTSTSTSISTTSASSTTSSSTVSTSTVKPTTASTTSL